MSCKRLGCWLRGERWQTRFLWPLVGDQALRLENLLKLIHRDVNLNLFLGPGADQFAAGEDKNHNLRLVHTVDKSWKLFRFVHGLLQTIDHLLQINVAA